VRRVLAAMGIDTWDSISARIELDTGAFITIDTSWILPNTFEAVINQAVRIVGDSGIVEIDGQDRGHRGFTADGGETLNLGFYEEYARHDGSPVYIGYGIDAIDDFYRNVAFLLAGGGLSELAGTYPDSAEGAVVTQVGVAALESAQTGRPVELEPLAL